MITLQDALRFRISAAPLVLLAFISFSQWSDDVLSVVGWLNSLGLFLLLSLTNVYRTKVLWKLSLDSDFSNNSGLSVYENVVEMIVAQ